MSPTTRGTAVSGTWTTTAASRDVPASDLVVKEKVPVFQVTTQCARQQETLLEKEWCALTTVFTEPGFLCNVSQTTLKVRATTGLSQGTLVVVEGATITVHVATENGAARGTWTARQGTSASRLRARSSASASTSTSARILDSQHPPSPTVGRTRRARTSTVPSRAPANLDTPAFRPALVAST